MRQKIVAAGLAVLGIAAGTAAPAAAETLRFNQITPATHFFHSRLLVPWANSVDKATAGRVKIEFTGSSLGPMPRQFDLALNGVADITTGNQAAIPGRFPMTLITEVPFLGDDAERVSVALLRVHQKHLAKADEYKGTKLLTLFTSGPSHFFMVKEPLESMDSLQGRKLRVSGITLEKMAKAFGAVTVATPVSEIYDVISKGVVDGTITTDTAITGWKIDKYIKHEARVPGGLSFGPFFIVVNQAKWDAIAPADQKAIEALSGEKLAREAGRIFDEEDDKSVAVRKAGGSRIDTLGGPALDQLKAKLGFIEQDWIAAANAKGIDGAAALAMLRAEAQKKN